MCWDKGEAQEVVEKRDKVAASWITYAGLEALGVRLGSCVDWVALCHGCLGRFSEQRRKALYRSILRSR